MGKDIHVHIIKRCKNEWKEINLFTEEKLGFFKRVLPYSYRNYELFDYLDGSEDDDFSCIPTPVELETLPDTLKEKILKYKDVDGYYGFHEINMADFRIYLLKNPTVRDYEDENPNAVKENPLQDFFKTILNYISFVEWWVEKLSDYRVVYWFDY